MAFWKPGTVAPGSSIDRASQAEAVISSRPIAANLSISAHRSNLPIAKQRRALLHAVEKYPVTIVVGQTGCGKSTQLPQFLFEAGWASEGRVIACTQPRRVAATSVAARVAEEVGSVLGDEVGYTIRFEDLSSPTRTRIKYLTDGMLFREIMLDPLLSRYSVIMIDEAHERSSYTDLLLGVLKKIRRKRPELRLIVSSATIDAQSFADYFNADAGPADQREARVVSLEGRTYPVEIAYLAEPAENYVQAAVDCVLDIHLTQPAGDILVFLTGRDEIDGCAEAILEAASRLPRGSLALVPLPLHAGLSPSEQLAAFEPAPRDTRKVVVSTNIAEASVTIEGLRYVVDSGLVKLRTFDPNCGIDVLSVVPISRASADQRAGRAGRTAPGRCLRLYPERTFSRLQPQTVPEIARSDVSLFILQLKALGIDNVLRFDFLTAPPAEMLARALEFLLALGALEDSGRLSKPLGSRMAEVPLEPMMAKILLDSHSFGCSDEILTIAAMTAVQNPFLLGGDASAAATGEIERRKFTVEEGDHLTLLNAYNAFVKQGRKTAKWCHQHRLDFKALSRAVSIRGQLAKYLARFGIPLVSCGEDANKVRRCITSGYFRNAAKMSLDGTYLSVREKAVLHVHPTSVLFTRKPSTGWVVFHEVIETSKRFMRDLTVIDPAWLTELASHYYESA